MIKVIVNGACSMGSTVVDAVMKDSELKLVGAVDIVGGMDMLVIKLVVEKLVLLYPLI